MSAASHNVPARQAVPPANTPAHPKPPAAGLSVLRDRRRANPTAVKHPHFQKEKPGRFFAEQRAPVPRCFEARTAARQPKRFRKRRRARAKSENAREGNSASCLLHCSRQKHTNGAGGTDRGL